MPVVKIEPGPAGDFVTAEGFGGGILAGCCAEPDAEGRPAEGVDVAAVVAVGVEVQVEGGAGHEDRGPAQLETLCLIHGVSVVVMFVIFDDQHFPLRDEINIFGHLLCNLERIIVNKCAVFVLANKAISHFCNF